MLYFYTTSHTDSIQHFFSLILKQLAKSLPLKISASLNGIFSHEVMQHFSWAQNQYFLQTGAYQPLRLFWWLNNHLWLIPKLVHSSFLRFWIQTYRYICRTAVLGQADRPPQSASNHCSYLHILEHAENAVIKFKWCNTSPRFKWVLVTFKMPQDFWKCQTDPNSSITTEQEQDLNYHSCSEITIALNKSLLQD